MQDFGGGIHQNLQNNRSNLRDKSNRKRRKINAFEAKTTLLQRPLINVWSTPNMGAVDVQFCGKFSMRELKTTNTFNSTTNVSTQADLPNMPVEDFRLAMRLPGTPGAPGVVQ